MDTQTHKWVAAGLLAIGGGLTILFTSGRTVPSMMRKMMRGMRQSMMQEMMGSDGRFNPSEM